MGPVTAVLSLALATHAVNVDNYPLRDGCEESDRVVAHLNRGDPVQIRFALAGGSGTCYKVAVQSGAQQLQGYVSAQAIAGLDQFEQARRSASVTEAPAMLRSDMDEIRKNAAARGYQDPGAKAARLLDQNRPREALQILEGTLKRNRRDAGLLSLAGYAAYKSDDMRLAMDYWRESLEMHQNPAVERLFRIAEREAREDKSGEKLVGTQFTLRYNRNVTDAATARRAVTLLDREYLRISQELGCRVEERLVAIMQSKEEYLRTTDASEWSSGQYDGRIRVAVMDGQQLGEQTRRTFSHEVVHACMAQLGRFPQWLDEGLAQKLSGERLDGARLAQMRTLAASGQLPSLRNLSQTWSRMSTLHAAVAYSTALAAVELFYQHYSGLGVRNLLRNRHLIPQIEADLDRRLRQ